MCNYESWPRCESKANYRLSATRLALRARPKIGFDARGNARVMWAEDMVAGKDDVLGLLAFALGPEQLLAAFSRDLELEPEPCAYRKSNPDIFVMQCAEDWAAKNTPCPFYGAR
jgi:hypothetical protein